MTDRNWCNVVRGLTEVIDIILKDEVLTFEEKRALERAQSWMKNITNPMSADDAKRWYDKCAMAEEEAFYDDHDIGGLANILEAGATDEDKRIELSEHDEMEQEMGLTFP